MGPRQVVSSINEQNDNVIGASAATNRAFAKSRADVTVVRLLVESL